MIDGLVTRLSPRVEQDTVLGLQVRTDSVEKPAVRVNLLPVFLLEQDDKLNGHKVVADLIGAASSRHDQIELRVDGKLRRVLLYQHRTQR